MNADDRARLRGLLQAMRLYGRAQREMVEICEIQEREYWAGYVKAVDEIEQRMLLEPPSDPHADD